MGDDKREKTNDVGSFYSIPKVKQQITPKVIWQIALDTNRMIVYNYT